VKTPEAGCFGTKLSATGVATSWKQNPPGDPGPLACQPVRTTRALNKKQEKERFYANRICGHTAADIGCSFRRR